MTGLVIPNDDPICYSMVTCARCGLTGQCTPWSDYYTTPFWEGPKEDRVCEHCLNALFYASRRAEKK